MRIEEYISTLPKGIVSGDDVQAPPRALRRMLSLAGARRGDTVMHLGCGCGDGLRIALGEFGVDRAIGMDTDPKKVDKARAALRSVHGDSEVICGDAVSADVSRADVVLFWFADEGVATRLRGTLASLRDGARVVSVRDPPVGCMPERVDFPFVLSVAPFREAASVRDQLLAILGVRCVDFVTAWEYSERYTRAIGPEGANEGNRFLTMMQAVTTWIGARNLGVACTGDIPESVRTYIGILREFYGIDVSHLLEDGDPRGQ